MEEQRDRAIDGQQERRIRVTEGQKSNRREAGERRTETEQYRRTEGHRVTKSRDRGRKKPTDKEAYRDGQEGERLIVLPKNGQSDLRVEKAIDRGTEEHIHVDRQGIRET